MYINKYTYLYEYTIFCVAAIESCPSHACTQAFEIVDRGRDEYDMEYPPVSRLAFPEAHI